MEIGKLSLSICKIFFSVMEFMLRRGIRNKQKSTANSKIERKFGNFQNLR
jgi:hypothetical protein